MPSGASNSDEGGHLRAEYVLTLTYLPPLRIGQSEGRLSKGKGMAGRESRDRLPERFRHALKGFENVFGSLFPYRATPRPRLVDEYGSPQAHDAFRYFQRCSREKIIHRPPDIPVYLTKYACGNFCAGSERVMGRSNILVRARWVSKVSFALQFREIDRADGVPLEQRSRFCSTRRSSRILDHTRKKGGRGSAYSRTRSYATHTLYQSVRSADGR